MSAPQRLVIYNDGPDTAGVGIALKRAFDRHAPDWQARAICRKRVYLSYPEDIVWPRGSETGRSRREAIAVLAAADVVHVVNSERGLRVVNHHAPRSALRIVHHVGTHYRRSPRFVSTFCRRQGAAEATDSIDLVSERVPFLPTPLDLDELAEIRRRWYRPRKTLRIAHAPTDRGYKSTREIVAAVTALAERYPISFDLIEGVSNAECLVRKAQADVFVDQLTLGFGVNNIEAWAMGIPVVSGLADPAALRRAQELFGPLPWANATPQTLEAVVEHLLLHADWRAELGARGRAHAEAWHSEASVVERCLALYEAGARA